MANLRSGLLITADASGAVKAVRLTKKEVGTLAKTTKDFGKQTKSASDHIEKARASLDKYAKAFAAVGAAGVAAMSAVVKHGAEAAKQIEVISRLAGVSVETFQVQANAAATVGVEMDKYADIMKDVQDKVGDFLQNGGGPMKDFFDNIAPQVGVTAKQFKELSGPQALQLYVSSLEKANLSNSEMTFYMEAIASDATLLLPLMKNNAKAFKDLGDKAKDAGLYLSQMDVKNLVKLDNTFLQISQSFETMSNIFAAELSPFIQAIADEFLDASTNANDFREYIRDAIELAAKGTGYFMDMVHGVKVVSTAVEAFFKTIGIGWGQTIDGARLFVKGVEVRLAEAQLFFVEFWGDIVRFAEDAINEIIEAYNKIPFFSDVEPVKLSAPDTTAHVKKINDLKLEYDTIQDGITLGFEQMGEAWAEVGELMLQELPSVELNKRVQEIFRNVEAESKKIAEAQKETTKEVIKTVEATKLWKPEIEGVGNEFESVFDDVFSKIGSQFDGLTREIFDGFSGLISDMSSTGGGLNLGLSGLFGGGATAQGKGGAAVIGPDAALGQGFLNSALPIAGTAGISYLVDSFIGNAKNGKWNDALDDALPFFQPGKILSALGIEIGGKPSDKTQSITVGSDFLTQGGLTGDKFSQENRDAADIAGNLLSLMFSAIESKTGSALGSEYNLNVGGRGLDLYKDGETIFEDRAEELGVVVNEIFDDMLADAGITADAYKAVQQEGELLVDTLARADTQLATVAQVTETLGINFSVVGDSGLIAADALVQAAGGLDAFVAKTDYFYQNFYSEEERLKNVIDASTLAIADFNAAMGTAIDDKGGLRDFVDSLDLTTEAGQSAYAAAIDLAPSLVDLGNATARLDEITKPATDGLWDLIDAVKHTDLQLSALTETAMMGPATPERVAPISLSPVLSGGLPSILSGYAANDELSFLNPSTAPAMGPATPIRILEDAVEDFNDVVEQQIDNVVNLIDYEKLRADTSRNIVAAYEKEQFALESFVDSMGAKADDLRGFADSLLIGNLSSLSPAEQYAEAKRQFESIINSDASSTEITSAADTFLNQSRSFHGSAGSYASDFDFVRSTLNAAADLADGQKDTAQKQLEQLEKQVSEVVELKQEVKTLQEYIQILAQINRDAANAQLAEAQKQTGSLESLESNSNLQTSAA